MDTASQEKNTVNSSFQEDEIQALSAIYGDEWIIEGDNAYSINISDKNGKEVCFQVTLPESYPLYSPPIYQFSAPWMSREEKNRLLLQIEDVYSQNIGESIIYLWIDTVRNFIEQESSLQAGNLDIDSSASTLVSDESTRSFELELENLSVAKDDEYDEIPEIKHGEPIIDRKSVFQAHLSRVVCVKQVKQVLEKLQENRKIAAATHNIHAYRISGQSKNTFIQDCEDDGETKAGSGLLHLLQVLDVSDILVVVSRWYGGIHLGADRFKHINNAARSSLSHFGFIKDEKNKVSSKSSKK